MEINHNKRSIGSEYRFTQVTDSKSDISKSGEGIPANDMDLDVVNSQKSEVDDLMVIHFAFLNKFILELLG